MGRALISKLLRFSCVCPGYVVGCDIWLSIVHILLANGRWGDARLRTKAQRSGGRPYRLGRCTYRHSNRTFVANFIYIYMLDNLCMAANSTVGQQVRDLKAEIQRNTVTRALRLTLAFNRDWIHSPATQLIQTEWHSALRSGGVFSQPPYRFMLSQLRCEESADCVRNQPFAVPSIQRTSYLIGGVNFEITAVLMVYHKTLLLGYE